MKHLFTTLLGLLVATTCLAWGQKGHDTTCAIAQRHMTLTTRARINAILDGKSILYWSNWFDNAVHQPEFEYAKTWHYKNIDEGQQFDDVPPFETGDVVSKLDELARILKESEQALSTPGCDSTAIKAQEALALKMLVHLMGDLHQPMHMGRKTDLGGNRVSVKYFGRDANLHGIWDTNLVESAHAWSHSEWVEEIDRTTGPQRQAICAGTFSDWGRETHGIALQVYEDTPEGTKVSYDYVAKWSPVIEEQFLRGGLRLAKVLNDIFDAEGRQHLRAHHHAPHVKPQGQPHPQHRRDKHHNAKRHTRKAHK